ncbi:hypothetical protein OV203_26145 [Nannocystis sp. ILAH1]|uniref:hypothetical protein n=1 Tax=Nannocystis sp. ILAH1 TaxID=2996789 RepID=UPI00227092C5|nr:hypothetical protein [Nannocystis sp. ILAH1]MCY0990652.1 hypothetical protein [Nannocystis sp. ILAH1]
MTDQPKPRRKRRRSRGVGRVILMVLDKYLVVVSAGLVVGVWLVSDWVGLPLSEGAKGALTAFLGYAAIKQRTDGRWRELEVEREQVRDLVESLDGAPPGSPQALEIRRELVALARQAEGGHDDE